ncbi:MAG: winged helix-turn-helix domain-containing protein [Actinomycetota bacterium]
MADIVIASERPEDLWPLVNGLEAGGHRVVVSGPVVEPPDPDPSIVVVDAVKDLSRARDLCRALRARSPRLPLMALVAVDAVDAVGPDWDVDSFLVEHCAIPEALARIRLALGSQAVESSGTVRVGDLSVDPETYQVRLRGRPLDLTYKEFQLLFFLAQRPGRVFSRQQLLLEVWGYDFFGGTRTVDVHVRRLRAKLGAEHEGMIATIRNVGYKMESHRARHE